MLSTIKLQDDKTLLFTPIGNARPLTFTRQQSLAGGLRVSPRGPLDFPTQQRPDSLSIKVFRGLAT